jgi:hypothetical protein
MRVCKKRVVKMNVGYIQSVIYSLNLLNESTEEQVHAFCGRTKTEAIGNVIKGIQSELDHLLVRKTREP